jgi:glycosyltransferase involved in cell wall biosynthesis
MNDTHQIDIQSDFPDISVILPTYRGDTDSKLAAAIDSLADQTLLPEEVLIIKDGPLTDDLKSVIAKKSEEFPRSIRTHRIEENQGLGNALRRGVAVSSNDIVARMDADDISVPSRFENQVTFLRENPDVDIVGGYIEEFESDLEEPIARREVPTDHDIIEKMARSRSPMNHATVMFKKGSVLTAGNYRAVDRMEDYDLWIRMLLNDAKFANIPDVLVKARGGKGMYIRRGGLEYAREEIRTQIEFYRRGFLPFHLFLFNLVTRVAIRFLPSRVRGVIYKSFTRN